MKIYKYISLPMTIVCLFTTVITGLSLKETNAAWSASSRVTMSNSISPWIILSTPKIQKTTSGTYNLVFSTYLLPYLNYDVEYSTSSSMTNPIRATVKLSKPQGFMDPDPILALTGIRSGVTYYVRVKAVGNPLNHWSDVHAIVAP